MLVRTKTVTALSLLATAMLFVNDLSAQAVVPVNPATPILANRETSPRLDQAQAGEHQLMPVLRWAEAGRPAVAAIKDYTALMTKQENINGELQGAQIMELKVRHQPFSVYLKFRYPQAVLGREAIYVAGANNNKLIAHGVGIEKAFGTQFLDPEGIIAMRGNKYPITKTGMLNLVDELVTVGALDTKYGECEVNYIKDAKYDERPCTIIDVTHPIPRKTFRFHKARIVVDNELNMPVMYQAFDWPKEGEKPVLLEGYTYQKIKINVGLTDKDFEHTNSSYGYRESVK
ncbi:MAG: DUF1571 domain-containing protein [Planctomycetaceae bacterium]|nr:DUF1571 domain-containing protein [Planctomycetaceae bacterium]